MQKFRYYSMRKNPKQNLKKKSCAAVIDVVRCFLGSVTKVGEKSLKELTLLYEQ